MARRISVQGKQTGIPGLYSQGIEAAGPLSPGPLQEGVVAIIATSDGGLKPQTPMLLRSARGVAPLGKGNLGKGADALFNPSRDDRRQVRGASAVLVVRPEAALQASKSIQSGTPADLFDLKSAAYGLKGAGLAYEIAAGSLGAFGKKLTIHKTGQSAEMFEDLGFLPALIVRYTGDADPATITISDTQITTALTSPGDGSANLTISFATYDTIQKIADYINAQTGYEAVIVTNQPDSKLGKDLDYVTGANIKTKSASITVGSTSGVPNTTFSGTISGLADGDIIKVEDEYMYVTDAATPTVIRGYLDSTPVDHTAKTGTVYTGLTEVVKRMMDTANNSSSRVVADNRTANAGTPAVAAKTYLTGAAQPAATSDNYKDALAALDGYSFDFLVIDEMSAAVHATVSAWLAERWGASANEVQAHLAARSGETLSQIRNRCKALQDPNVSLWFQDPTRNAVKSSPWLEACLAAGIQAGMAPGTPLTGKSMRVENLEQEANIKIQGTHAEDFVLMGASFGRYDGDDFRIVRCLSTYTNDDTFFLISPNVRYAIARTEKLIRSYIKTRHFGKRGVSGEAGSVKSTIIDALEDAKEQGLIVDGAKRTNGILEEIPAFDPANIFVERVGNVIEYEATYVPVDGNDFFVSSNRVAEWQDAA